MIEQHFCPFCGTLTVPGAAFCVKCGQAVAAATPPAASAAVVVPPAAPPPAAAFQPPAVLAAPAPPVATQPTAPPPATAHPVGPPPPAYPVPVAVGIAVVVVVAVLVAFFLLSGSGNKPGITYDPSSLSCTGESFTVTMRLPASVGSGDYLAMLVDGQVWPSATMWTPGQGGFVRQSDSTWFLTTASQTPGAAECGLAPGNHTLQIVDANGLVLGQGSLTRQ